MVVLREPIQPAQRSVKVADDGQLGFGVTDAQNPVHISVADDDPVHIPSPTLDADVVQGGKALTAEKVESAQIEDELFRGARVALDEASKGLAVGRIDVA